MKTINVLLDTTGGKIDQIPAYIEEVFDRLPELASVNKRRRRELAQERRVWVDEVEYQLRERA